MFTTTKYLAESDETALYLNNCMKRSMKEFTAWKNKLMEASSYDKNLYDKLQQDFWRHWKQQVKNGMTSICGNTEGERLHKRDTKNQKKWASHPAMQATKWFLTDSCLRNY